MKYNKKDTHARFLTISVLVGVLWLALSLFVGHYVNPILGTVVWWVLPTWLLLGRLFYNYIDKGNNKNE